MQSVWLLVAALLLLTVSGGESGVVERHQAADSVDVLFDDEGSKDQISVAVIEVQEPETALHSLQADTAIQTTDNSAAEREVSTIDEADSKETATELIYSSFNAKTEAPEAPEASDGVTVLEDKIATETVPLDEAPLVIEVIQQQQQQQQQQSVESEPDSAVRQATPATPSQSTTPQNFVQFIQASPIGQFFSQLTGGQQQQQSQQQQQQTSGAPEGVAADQPAATPSVPGFLNPATALTQAQQVVQNAAQSVVNTTSQAFQGLQQFASNIGNQFQNTLSSLSGQNQLSSTDSSSVRPPGPIQSLVNNLVGGGANQGANIPAGGQAPGQQQQQQQQGPLQGIISFFQGGNRPQTNNNNNNNVIPANKPPKKEEQEAASGVLNDPIQEQQVIEADAINEVRNSDETLDSFEEHHSGPLIVVNDDPSSAITELVSNV